MATLGNCNKMWDGFDKRLKAKAAAGTPAAEQDLGESGDMFSRAGVAAE